MGFSNWHHLDFKEIRSEKWKSLEVVTDDGRIHLIRRSYIADHEDYQPGDKNGTMSIPERIAKKLGMRNGNS